jgi:hypothetical protein
VGHDFRALQAADGDEDELLKLSLGEEGVLARKLDPRGNVVLNEASEGVARGGHDVLVVRVDDVVGLGARKLALCVRLWMVKG